jgi:hypothetical protein
LRQSGEQGLQSRCAACVFLVLGVPHEVEQCGAGAAEFRCIEWRDVNAAAQVKAGKLAPGTRLPAERDLAEQWAIAYMTVRRMMAELRERGVVVSQPGKGTYVL